MNDEEVFNKLFSHYGGLFDIHSLAEDERLRFDGIKMLWERSLKKLKASFANAPDIYFNFIQSWKLNAAATLNENKYYVGFNIGLYFILLDMYTKIFSTRKLYENLGDNKKEREEKTALSLIIDEGSVAYNYDKDNTPTPKDEQRKLYASCFITWAFQFIIDHELCHIIHGHVKYLNDKKSIKNFEEIPALKDFENFQNPFIQSLEIDCDSFATLTLYNKFKSFIKNPHNQPPVWNQIYSDGKLFLRSWIYTIYPLFRILGYHPDWSVYNKSSHPPPLVRFTNSFTMLTGALIKDGYIDIKNVEDFFNKAFVHVLEADYAFTSVTYHEFNANVIVDLQGRNNVYKDYLLKVLVDNRHLIQPYAYTNLG